MLLGVALLKAVVVLAVILVFGQRLMRRWFHIVARAKSSEVFILNVLLITLGLAYLTEHAGLSLALGAFVAGMLISETEYRLQVEEDIKPFRDVLMGLFFVTIGVKLDINIVIAHWWQVLLLLAALLALKGAIVGLLSWRLGAMHRAMPSAPPSGYAPAANSASCCSAKSRRCPRWSSRWS